MPRSVVVIVIVSMSVFLAGCNIPLFGYPHFWDYPQSKPTDADMVGTYRVSRMRLSKKLTHAVLEKEAVIVLNADQTGTLTNFPDFDAFANTLVCRVSGSVNWRVDHPESYWVSFESHRPEKNTQESDCELEGTVFPVIILSRHAPYRLYWTVGDPDSDEGIEFEKVGR